MKGRIMALAAALALLLAAAPAMAQEAPRTPDRVLGEIGQVVEESGIAAAIETVAAATVPALRESLAQLALSLGAVANRIAEDEELQSSLAVAGQGMLEVAEVVVVEQSGALQEALRAMADRIGEVAAERQRHR
jgi:hypothetical protein